MPCASRCTRGSIRYSGRRHYLRETVPAGPTRPRSLKVRRRLANQVDERRNPRTSATVEQLLDRHFEMLDIERDTLANYAARRGCTSAR